MTAVPKTKANRIGAVVGNSGTGAPSTCIVAVVEFSKLCPLTPPACTRYALICRDHVSFVEGVVAEFCTVTWKFVAL